MKRRAKNRPDIEFLEGRMLLSTGDPVLPFICGDSYIPGKTDLDLYRAVLDSQTAVVAARPSVTLTGTETTTALVTPESDPGDLGPLAVWHVEYTFGDSAFTPTGPGFPSPWPVELTASVTYPTDLPSGPYPLIVLEHGRHSWSQSGMWPPVSPSDAIPSYEGYDYLGENLASYGNFVVSISTNGINALDNSSPDLGTLARAELLQRHLDILRDLDTTGVVTPFGTSPFGTQFVGKIDLQNIGTMGHSRGGEGVIEQYLYNEELGSPYGIKAVFALAPVDFSREVINGVPLGVLLPYNDGDVSDLQGVHFYDDARYNVSGDQAPKHTFYVLGANHNFFNTVWTPGLYPYETWDDGVGPADSRLSPDQERGVGEAYMAAFFRTYIDHDFEFFPYLTGDAAPPPSAQVTPDQVFVSYHPADNSSARLDVNRLLDPSNLVVNTLGGTTTQEGLSPYVAVGGDPPEDPYVLYADSTPQEPHTVDSYLAPGRRGLSQLVMGWDSPDAYYENDLPAGSRDVSRYPVLQFRAGLNFIDSRNPYGQPQDFSVVLTDGAGHSASTLVSDWSRALFYPPSFGWPTPKLFLNGVRIPLSAFTGVDLTDLRSIRFNFDQRSTGDVVLTDLMFANQSLRMSVVSTTPGVGSVVLGDTPPTEFVVRISDPYDPSSVQPGDLTVNGVPADEVELTTDKTLTFRFTSSPVKNEGLQTMAITDGAITSSSDGQPIAAFQGTFYYYVVLSRVTTTTVASSFNPSVYGGPVTFKATVSGLSPVSGTPTGTVEFFDGASHVGTGVVISGIATLTTSSLGVGTHSISAQYSGDDNFAASNSAILDQSVNQAASTTGLNSSSPRAVYGQAVTLTVVVSPVEPGSGTPTGSVEFYDGTTDLGPGSLNSSGKATFTTSPLTVGSHKMTASYGGDGNFTGSSTTLTQTVNKDAMSAAITSSASPSVFGQSISFTVTVTANAPGSGTPTGTVQFLIDGKSFDSPVTLANGTATSDSISTLTVGNHTISATYAGDSNFLTTQTSSFTQTVQKDGTKTGLLASTNPSVYGQSVTFTATVSAAVPGGGTPAGTVTFKDGSTTLGTASLSAGTAMLTTSKLATATHSITAVYGSSSSYLGSTSAVLNQEVDQDATRTAVSSSINPSVYGQSVTFTATVTASAPGSGTPTGTVTFYDGSTQLGTGTLNSSSSATLAIATLGAGTHTITATYGGDTNFLTSTSATFTQTVNQDATQTALTSSHNPSVYGQSVTFTATVTASSPGSGTPTGSVEFYDGTTDLGPGSLNSSGKATFITSSLSVGTHSITASYGGDSNFLTSTSTALSQKVNQASTSTSLKTSANPSTSGQPVTFTATISVTSPGSGTPTGTATFYDGSNQLGTGSVSGSVATYTTSTLSTGTHSIKAVYGSDTNFKGSTSSLLSQVVKSSSGAPVFTDSSIVNRTVSVS